MEMKHKLSSGIEFTISESAFCKVWRHQFPDVFLSSEKPSCGICAKFHIAMKEKMDPQVTTFFL